LIATRADDGRPLEGVILGWGENEVLARLARGLAGGLTGGLLFVREIGVSVAHEERVGTIALLGALEHVLGRIAAAVEAEVPTLLVKIH
jgi:hypothetical protein